MILLAQWGINQLWGIQDVTLLVFWSPVSFHKTIVHVKTRWLGARICAVCMTSMTGFLGWITESSTSLQSNYSGISSSSELFSLLKSWYDKNLHHIIDNGLIYFWYLEVNAICNSLWPSDAICQHNWVNIGSGCGLLAEGTKSLPEPKLI